MPDPAFGRAFVMGGTGMLAGATRWLAERSERVLLAARRPDALAGELGAEAPRLDWSDPAAPDLIGAQAGAHDLALIWLHDEAAALSRHCEDTLTPGGRVIRVHGALSADRGMRARRQPDRRQDVAQQIVILGYHPEPDAEGGKRWLTDDEISGGVIAALRDPSLEALTIGSASGA